MLVKYLDSGSKSSVDDRYGGRRVGPSRSGMNVDAHVFEHPCFGGNKAEDVWKVKPQNVNTTCPYPCSESVLQSDHSARRRNTVCRSSPPSGSDQSEFFLLATNPTKLPKPTSCLCLRLCGCQKFYKYFGDCRLWLSSKSSSKQRGNCTFAWDYFKQWINPQFLLSWVFPAAGRCICDRLKTRKHVIQCNSDSVI